MITSTAPYKGVHTDNSIHKHDPAFARESENGRFTEAGNNLSWSSIKPLKDYITINNCDVLGVFDFQGLNYVFFLEGTLFKISRYNEYDETFTKMFQRENSDFGFSINFPIRSCSFWTNVSESKLRVYFTDNNTNPWAIDLLDPLSETTPVEDLTFSPRAGTPVLDLYQVTNGGSLLCGKYYYAIQCYKKTGVSTDWIMIHTPVEVPNLMPSLYTPSEYQGIEGENNQFKSSIKVILQLVNVSEFSDWFCKIAAFYALDEYKLDTGKVFYDGKIDTGIFTHSTNIELESVAIEKVRQNTISIKKVGVISSNGEINTIGDIEINELIPDENTVFDNIKFKERPTITLKRKSNGQSTGITSPILLDVAISSNVENFTTQGKTKQCQFSEKLQSVDFEELSPRTYKKHGDINWNKVLKNYGPGFADYTNPHLSFRNRIYRSGEPVRLGIVPFDLYGKPLRPLWIGDLEAKTGYPNDNSPQLQLASYSPDNRVTWYQKNKLEAGVGYMATDGDFFVNESSTPNRLQLDYNWIEINGLNLKDFIKNGVPQISGFSIVQSEPKLKRFVTEGFFTGITKKSLGPDAVWCLKKGGGNDGIIKSGGGWILLYSPDYFFNGVKPEPGDKIVCQGYGASAELLSALQDDMYYEYNNNAYMNFKKMYYRFPLGSLMYLFTNALVETTGTIEKVIEMPNLPDTPTISVEGYGTLSNAGRDDRDEHKGMGNKKALLIKLKDEPGLYSYFRQDASEGFALNYWLCRVEKAGYGFTGQTDSDLATTTYKFINHYQKTDIEFFNSIFNSNDNSYLCDISVYGGQYYAGVFEVMRLSKYTNSNGNVSNTVYFPVVVPFNIRMRTGARHSRDRILGDASGSHTNPTGIGLRDTRGGFEDFLYADSYKSISSGKEMLPVRNDFQLNNKISNVVYWSEKQSIQGDLDYFRKIYASSYMLCDLGGKNITGLQFTKDRLIVFQKHAIGFLPYNERILASMSNSSDLVVSYGSIFPKYENIDRFNGIVHNLMQVLTPEGIVFYNSMDKTLNILSDSLDDLSRKLGIFNLVSSKLTNISKLLYSKDDKRVAILSDKKVLEISLNPTVVNGLMIYDLSNNLDIITLGNSIAICNKNDQGVVKIYKENESGDANLNSYYKLRLVLGVDQKTLFKKTFDNLIIQSQDGYLPKTFKIIANGKESMEETFLDSKDCIVNGSIIYTNIPFISVENSGGIISKERISDSFVCEIELKSDERFILESVTSEFRQTK